LRNGERLNRQPGKKLQQQLNAADPRLQIVPSDAARMDVGSKSQFVAVPADAQPVQEFGSWKADLQRMAAWAEILRHPHGGHAVHWGVLDRRSANFGTGRSRRQGWESSGVQVPVLSIACVGVVLTIVMECPDPESNAYGPPAGISASSAWA
jgi:hypothetical protein